MTREETWNGLREWPVEAHYFELLAAPAAVDILIYGKDGRVLASDKGVRPGYFHDRRGLDAFGTVTITNSASQAVKGLFSDGLSGTKAFSPQWYDRNPVTRANYYAAGGGAVPHGATVRWSYTVPAGKKFMLEFGKAEALRQTPAAAPSTVQGWVRYTPSGGAASVLCIGQFFGNNIDSRASDTIGQSLMLFAGDLLEGMTSDVSTDGTCSYNVNMKGTEFDA